MALNEQPWYSTDPLLLQKVGLLYPRSLLSESEREQQQRARASVGARLSWTGRVDGETGFYRY